MNTAAYNIGKIITCAQANVTGSNACHSAYATGILLNNALSTGIDVDWCVLLFSSTVQTLKTDFFSIKKKVVLTMTTCMDSTTTMVLKGPKTVLEGRFTSITT